MSEGMEQNVIIDKEIRNVTAVIRVVGQISLTRLRIVQKLLSVVREILIVYSGDAETFSLLSNFFYEQHKIRCIRVYSFGYMEPILTFIFKLINTTWIILFTETEDPSDDLIKEIPELICKDIDIYFISRKTFFKNDEIPSWVKELYMTSFKPVLFKKSNLKICDIIHKPYEIKGKTEYLDPKKYYLTHTFQSDYSLLNVKEKIRRYILIELFTTRRSRFLFFIKFADRIGILSNKNSMKKNYSEMSILGYVLYDILANIYGKYFGLTIYQKIRIKAIKKLKKENKMLANLTYSISQEIYRYGSVLRFLDLESTDLEIHLDNAQLQGMEDFEHSCEIFLSLMVDRFRVLNQ